MNNKLSQKGRMVSYSLNYGFAWFRVAKTGTRSINKLFKEHIKDYTYLENKTPLPDEFLKMLSDECFCFTVIRNPWDRVVSGWANKIAGASPKRHTYIKHLFQREDGKPREKNFDQVLEKINNFHEFLELLPDSRLFANNVHFQPQTKILQHTPLDFVGRFENFSDDVSTVLHTLRLKHLCDAIPHQNKSNTGKHYSYFYHDLEDIDRVARLYQQDILKWDYEFCKVNNAS